MSKAITNAILENVSNKRLVEMPEGGDTPMGLLGQVLDAMTSLGWNYDEIDYSDNEGGYEFENWSPAGEDLILDACYGKKDLSDDEKGKNLMEDLINYCDNFDVDEHVEMWMEARGTRGVPSSARTLVEDAEEIEKMYQEIVKELKGINNPMNESYRYDWRDDIEEVDYNDEGNDDIFYSVAENIVDTDEYGEYEGRDRDDTISEVMSDIIGLYKINKRSRLYKYLLKWYGSEEKLLKSVRDVYDTDNAIYFVTGCGYAIFDNDLLGGNADGETERKFNKFVDEQEGNLNESMSDPVDVINYGELTTFNSRKEAMDFYLQCMTFSEGSERERYSMIYTDLANGEEYASDSWDEDPEIYKIGKYTGDHTEEVKKLDKPVKYSEYKKQNLKEDYFNPGKYFKLLQDMEDTDPDKWNSASQEERDAMVRPYLQKFWDTYKEEMTEKDIKDLFDDMEDSNYHTPARILLDIIKSDDKGLNESADVDVEYIAHSDTDANNEDEFFDSKKDAIKYCKENDLDCVIKVNNDEGYEEIVWVNDKKDLNESVEGNKEFWETYKDKEVSNVEVIDVFKDDNYIIVKRDVDYMPYVAAWNPEFDGDKLVWGQGHYFNTEEDARNYIKNKDLTESAKVKLTEAPEENQEDEEFVLADDGDLTGEDIPVEEPTEEEMSDAEYEEEAEDDAKETVEDDVEEPFYATNPDFDELRDILPDLDYRLLLINGKMVCIGRLNGADIEVLTSNTDDIEKEAEKSEANKTAEDVEERAEEKDEDSFEYVWIKMPGTFDEYVNLVNVNYLSPDLTDEEKEQYAGLEVNHESLMNYLMNELPEDKRKEKENQVEEELEDDESTEEIEEPVEEELPEEEKEEEEK